VHVRPPNTLKLGRYCDASVVQQWLSEKGFRETAKAGAVGVVPFPLPTMPLPLRLVPVAPDGRGKPLPAVGDSPRRPSALNGEGGTARG